MRNWLLPEYIEDVLPAEAARLESLRRQLLDLFKVHGYQYIIPPTLEYLESLITGTGHDLDLATFKVVDQLTGRLMGIRADMTPQAARIDAHMLNHQGVSRLCYAGTVLRTKPDGLAHTREPLQLGAELFGHAGIESDIEIHRLMIKALQTLGLKELHIDFSHVAIFESLVKAGDINANLEQALYAALQSKDKAGVALLAVNLDSRVKQALMDLTDLNGDVSVLQKAEQQLPKLPAISKALADLRIVASQLNDLNVNVSFDLSELRGYHYHSGIVFAAYAKGYTGPIALGGRYDEVGLVFGRARPATGFSLDLRGAVTALTPAVTSKAILAPAGEDKMLLSAIETLRADGQIVIQTLPNSTSNIVEMSCDKQLVYSSNQWQIEPLKQVQPLQ
ncbi:MULTISPECIES: ATP phosphoribosyltransferase regulatory subunit [Methylotenera]|uniref:ATP phosphoribosyltransferase regulatory subunit n=1 Tax=Methylotenera TaxID=359407 RepID=UPI0003824745|nr:MULTISPECIES: ATP phosphoribosyltransferase regulatory subunit [Methylotenera]